MNNFTLGIIFATASLSVNTTTAMAQVSAADSVMNHAKGMAIAILHQVSIRKTQAMEDLIFPMLLFTLVMTLERVGQWEQK